MRQAEVEAVVDTTLSDYVVTYAMRPARRHDSDDRVIWSVEDDTIVELVSEANGHVRLRVHEVGLLTPLRRQLRSKRVVIEHVTNA